MNSQKNIINGGFPPIKYCPLKKEDSSKSKERFFANAPRQNINIRQLLFSIESETLRVLYCCQQFNS